VFPDDDFCENCGNPVKQAANQNQTQTPPEVLPQARSTRCVSCGSTLFPDDDFCENCGNPVKQAANQNQTQPSPEVLPQTPSPCCVSCGSVLIPNDDFCVSCGNPVKQVPNQNQTQTLHMMRPKPSTPTISHSFDSVKARVNDATDRLLGEYNEPTINELSTKQPHPYHQLGGWLAFFAYGQPIGAVGFILIGIIELITTLYGLYYLNQIFGGFSGVYGISFYIFLALLANFAIYTIFIVFAFKFHSMVKRKDPRFFRLFENTLIFFFGLSIILYLVTPYTSFTEIVSYVISTALVVVIWSLYFSKSVRVRTYFGSDEYLRRSIFLKNVTTPTPADVEPYTLPRSYQAPPQSYEERAQGSSANDKLEKTSLLVPSAKPPSGESIKPKNIFCLECGNMLPAYAKFCDLCGFRISVIG